MILIVTTEDHRYTHKTLAPEGKVDVRVISYKELKQHATRLPRGTYIFTDVDRLSMYDVRDAAMSYRALKRAGQRVLNDPARMLSRYGLLRALNRAGINDFDAYRLEEQDGPRRWPVFLRLDGGHGSPITDLLHTQEDLDAAVAEAVEKGVPKSLLLIIEYCAEPVKPGLFRKLSVFRVGDRLLGYTCVHDDQWIVKYGQPAIATAALYKEEFKFVSKHSYAEAMGPVFEIAGIEYGRVDFGLVGGKPQIYEINSNPDVKLRPEPSTVDQRNKSNEVFRVNYLEAMREIDTYSRSASAA